MKEGIPVLSVEIPFDRVPFVIENENDWRQLVTDHRGELLYGELPTRRFVSEKLYEYREAWIRTGFRHQ